MGITIFYNGKLNTADLAGAIVNELEDISNVMDWKYNIIEEDSEYFKGNEFDVTVFRRAIGKLERADLDKAEEYILKGMKMLEELMVKAYFSRGYFYLGELYAEAGMKEKAVKTLKKAENLFQEMGMDYWLDRTRKILERT